MADGLWERARSDLVVQTTGTSPDMFLWEHACRVERLTRFIAALPEAGTAPLNGPALEVAALYHDAGWLVQIEAGQLHPRDLLLRPTTDLQRELGADWITTRLEGVVGGGALRSAARILRECNDRRSALPEAQILAEAENLDEIGPQTVATMIRKQMAEGRTLAELVAAWERQEEYHFWQARIKECFRFASVRPIAEHRWRAVQRFMAELRESLRFEDVEKLLPSAAPQAGAAESVREEV